MKKGYMVIIPPHKDAWVECFGGMEKAQSLIASKLGSIIRCDPCRSFGSEATMISPCSVKKSSLPVNETATYFATHISEEGNVYGTVAIIGREDDRVVPLTKEAADFILFEINKLRNPI